MPDPRPHYVDRIRVGHSEDGELILLVFDCHDGRERSFALPHQAFDDLLSSLANIAVAAAKVRED